MSAILEALAVSRRFVGGDGQEFTVLRDLNFAVAPGEFVAIVGASGSGKSTLLHLLGALDRADAGEVLLEGVSYAARSVQQLSALRNRRIGFVFQFHHLLRDFTALENVMMPLLIGGVEPARARERSKSMLAELGLAARESSRVMLLSGGEQQRVALARAMVHEPAVLLADEPTGNLDPPTAAMLHELLADRAHRRNTALVVVTHNRDLALRADRVLTMADGHLREAATAELLP
jgi:lipoprotein-releasing system ATP-binding protein